MPQRFRPLTLEDRPAVETICAAVWDGQDYVPAVFDDWVADPGGAFTGLEREGELAGFAKLSRLAPGEYWLEGIRVASAHRGQGVAAALHAHHLALWRRLAAEEAPAGAATLRLVTGADNSPILRVCERTGFTRLFEFGFAEAAAHAGPPERPFVPVPADEAGAAFARLAALPEYAEQHGLCDLGWKWRALTPAYLAERAAAGGLYRWGEWDGVLLTLTDSPSETVVREPLWLQFAGARPGRRQALLADARTLAAALGKMLVRWSPLLRAGTLAALGRAGYTRPWPEAEVCFEIRP